MSDYRIRLATLEDDRTLVHHRVAMFQDMGIEFDPAVLDRAFRPWLQQHMQAGDYRAWVIETGEGEIVAGGGLTIIPWPPGPRYLGDRLAFVYNVYTEPEHRRRGLSRLVMQTIHDWCRAEGITTLALNASRFGQPLYESLGYAVTPSPMMFLPLD